MCAAESDSRYATCICIRACVCAVVFAINSVLGVWERESYLYGCFGFVRCGGRGRPTTTSWASILRKRCTNGLVSVGEIRAVAAKVVG